VLDVQRDGFGATGMAAAIIVRGRLFWSGGSGLANRETKAPATADTPFPIFSITKMFVGALAVKLAQEGRLKLDDPVSGALPDWPNADRISLRMLLNQTSGVGRDQRRAERDVDARPRAVWTPQKTLGYSRGRMPRPARSGSTTTRTMFLPGS
jgi:CubicO group peptidase (beta-lactamase class C family)